MGFLDTKLKTININTRTNSNTKTKWCRKVVNKKKKLTDIKQYCKTTPYIYIKFETREDKGQKLPGYKSALYYKINIHTLLASFFCGTVEFNIGIFSDFLDIKGGW